MEEFKRFQYQRTKGFRAPENRVSVKRPGKWGNPFPTGANPGDTEETKKQKHAAAVAKFEEWLRTDDKGRAIAAAAPCELRGKNLGCSCRVGWPCHGDVLFKIANKSAI
jgi:hypothetical protein